MTAEERLEVLEQEMARLKRRGKWSWAILCLAMGVFALVWYLKSSQVPKEVRANAFIAVDQNGKMRAYLGMSKDGNVGLLLHDEYLLPRAVLHADKDETWLDLYEAGRPRVILGALKDGPALRLADENGKIRAGLAEIENWQGLSLSDENGKWRLSLDVGEQGPMLTLADENGRGHAQLGAFKGGPSLQLADENSKPRVHLVTDKDGPRLHLCNENGKLIWATP